MLKRAFDLLISSVMLFVLSPAFLVIALWIRRDSPGPVFFRQERVGLSGQPFWIFKFRSMVTDAESVGPFYTSANDSRITRVGAFLRKTSLDELPQLINVLRGEMSLVGPRPNVYKQRDQYTTEEWELRNRVLPGITGLAQATKRSSATTEERNRLDLQYVTGGSFISDFRIILLTVRQMLTVGGN